MYILCHVKCIPAFNLNFWSCFVGFFFYSLGFIFLFDYESPILVQDEKRKKKCWDTLNGKQVNDCSNVIIGQC